MKLGIRIVMAERRLSFNWRLRHLTLNLLENNDVERHAFFKANCVHDFKNLNTCQELLNRISKVPDRSA